MITEDEFCARAEFDNDTFLWGKGWFNWCRDFDHDPIFDYDDEDMKIYDIFGLND